MNVTKREVPDRESLVLACQAAAAWRPDEGTSVMEVVVDEVIMPLLRRLTADDDEPGTSPDR